MYPKHSMKLSGTALRALAWWLEFIMQSTGPQDNYYATLVALMLKDLYERKVYPKTAILKKENRVKLSPQEALALSLSFSRYDYFDAPEAYQPHLYFISADLPKLRHDQEERFSIPLLNSNYGG